MIAISASEVMGAEVDDERMTCRNGWSKAGVSKLRMSAPVSEKGALDYQCPCPYHCSPSSHFANA